MRKQERKTINNGKMFWVRRADRVNGLETEEHQMFWERKEKTGDIKDEDKIYINGGKKLRE